ncbi:MAG TPA: MFS transporter [Pseudomonadales bacterium]|nr:MFS transporter [Pseudomonadales bacterium]
MRRLLLPIAALLLSDAFLLVGHGLQLTLLPLRANLEGFTDAEVGFTGSAYFVGFVVGCILTPHAVQRAGHIRSFAVLASGFSALVLMFSLLPNFWFWLALRAFTGACIAGLYMIIESWLNERATRETRGTVLSVYTIINLSMIVAGQQIINLADPSADTLFAISAILISVAIIPVSLTRALAPPPLHAVRVNLRAVWRMSRVGVGGAIASGLVAGAFWSLMPVYARGVGLDVYGLTTLMSAMVLGGALFQYPLGKLSDRYDRRLVLLWAALFGALVSALLANLGAGGGWTLTALAFLLGGSTMTMYAICLAHANDRAEPTDFVMVGTSILMLHGGACAVGGPLASIGMELLGPGGMFVVIALVLLVLAVGILRRRSTHYLPVLDSTEPFRALGDITPAALEMDPRTEAPATPAPDADPDAETLRRDVA